MKNIKTLDVVLHQHVSRKEFIQYVGIALLSVVGITSMLQRVRHLDKPFQQQSTGQAAGYGTSAYGR